MAKLNFKKQEVSRSVTSKLGLDLRSGKERNAWYYIDGKPILRVTLCKGRGVLPPGTANQIRKDLKLDKDQFNDLVGCDMRGSGFENHIRAMIKDGKL